MPYVGVDLTQQTPADQLEEPRARQVEALLGFVGPNSGVAVLVTADPRTQAYQVAFPPQVEQLFQDLVVEQAEEMKCLVLDGRLVGGMGTGGPHEV